MKFITTILLLVCLNANATNYYVSNAGSDLATGLIGNSWQHLSKINGFTFVSGDSIFLNKGDSWNEQLVPPISNLYFGSYGTGANPIITGFQTLTSWTNEGANIWSTTFSNSVLYQNTVYITDGLKAKGRYPNYSYLTFTSHSGKGQITGALTGTPNYTSGEVVIRTNHFTIDKGFISSQSSGTLNFYPPTYYALADNWGYFIQNIPSVLDTLNEWSYDSASKVIKVYSLSQPVAKASSIDTLVKVSAKNNISFVGIDFEGANIAAFDISNSDWVTVNQCNISSSGANGIEGKISNHLSVTNCTIRNCWNDGIIIMNPVAPAADSDDGLISFTTISNIGTAAGMNIAGFNTNTAIQYFGDRTRMLNNTMSNIGYIGVYFYGDTCLLKGNYLDTFCNVKNDGGGLYTWSGPSTPKRGSIMRGNIVMNGIDANSGTPDNNRYTWGIYLDNESQYVTVDSNVVYNNPIGLFVHESHYITFRENIVYNSTAQSLLISNVTTQGGAASAHVTFVKNTLVSQPVDIGLIGMMAIVGSNFDVMDSNYYYNRFDTAKLVRNSTAYYSLKAWQDSTGFDIHSYRKPDGTTSGTPILRFNNSTGLNYHTLSGTYIDMKGSSYSQGLMLAPNQSAILLKATVDVPPPLSKQINRMVKLKIRR